MFSVISEVLVVGLHTFLSFFFTNFVFFYFTNKFTKPVFLSIDYLVIFLVNFLLFYTYFKVNDTRSLSVFSVMAVSMIFNFVFQFIIYKFLYKGSMDFLNFEEYIVPMFITASVIFLVGTFLK